MTRKILIYDSNCERVALLRRELSHIDCAITVSDSLEEHSNVFDCAFVYYGLPVINLPHDTLVVGIYDTCTSMIDINLLYRPILVLLPPVSNSDVRRALELFDENPKPIDSYFSEIIDLKLLVRYMLIAAGESNIFKTSLAHAMDHFCLYTCGKAKCFGSSDEGKFNVNDILRVDERGIIKSCNEKSTCSIQLFLSKYSELDLLNDELGKIIGDFKCQSMSTFLQNIEGFLGEFIALKKAYCLDDCKLTREGLEFQNGDTILVNLHDLISGKCLYCKECDCKLSEFSHYFIDVVESSE
ncbi:MAG: hypothetical protein KAG61_04280 [Bacteriovoracaceae bacterium]|nr:hypothetical protein [Bacteriovoracaceae bacterium]